METRSGDLDPSLPLYLQRVAQISPNDVDDSADGSADACISRDDAGTAVWVVPTQEEE